MLPAFAQLLSRTSCRRCFSTRAGVFNAFTTAYSVSSPSSLPTRGAYTGLAIPDKRDLTWNDTPISDHVTGGDRSPEQIWRDNSRDNVKVLRAHPPPDPYQGRSVSIDGTVSFEEAAKELDRILARNRVRFTIRTGARHEKKGPKRRRIKSEQWRKHFAHQVRKTVQLVNKIRRRGV